MDFLGIIFIGFIIYLLIYGFTKASRITPQERQAAQMQAENKKHIETYGQISPNIICPHCQSRGYVHTIAKKRKKGISGAKATGAVLTLGFSMLATGLSRKETMTQAHCDNCGSTWDF